MESIFCTLYKGKDIEVALLSSFVARPARENYALYSRSGEYSVPTKLVSATVAVECSTFINLRN